ncbi:hypothetical protein NDU88_000839 [Pleurodeles waltl]|uniref:Uncharacterized protein n=1 Tax=Pleurodeles waltl TaxID=8319 RepID=A0AAV7U7J4_PLEWA|nr:hypothetical protein NDU88_000839 [Pleurodeles waltl]
MLITELHSVEGRLREVERRVERGGGDMKEVTEFKAQWTETDARLRKFDYQHYAPRMHAEGDRSSRLLSWLVKGEQQHSTINAISLDEGSVVNTQQEINEAFRQYYATLYKAGPPARGTDEGIPPDIPTNSLDGSTIIRFGETNSNGRDPASPETNGPQ